MKVNHEYPPGHTFFPVVGLIPRQTEHKKPGIDGRCGKPPFFECCFISGNRHQTSNRQTHTSSISRVFFARILPAAFHNSASTVPGIHLFIGNAPPPSSRSIRSGTCLPGHLSPPAFCDIGYNYSTIPGEYPSIIGTIKIKAEYERCLVIPAETKAL